jgi:predicted Zn finger-like uncharacterized protein
MRTDHRDKAMNLQCSNCQAEYAVPNARLGAHLVVRCSACDHTWTIGDTEEEQDDTDPEASADTTDENDQSENGEPIDEAPDEPAAAEPVARLSPPLSATPAPNRWLAAAWAGSAATIAACVIAACLYRTNVVAAWPPAGRLFAANPVVSIEHVQAQRLEAGTKGVLSKP